MSVRPPDETDFVGKIVSALSGALGIDNGRPYSPGSSKQGLSSLCDKDAFCDIIVRISNTRTIPLEIKSCAQKETILGKRDWLKYFNKDQRRVYQALVECGVPVMYCYNKAGAIFSRLTDIAILMNCWSSPPAFVCEDDGTVTKLDKRLSLLRYLRNIKVEDSSSGSANPLMSLIWTSNAAHIENDFGLRRLLLLKKLSGDYELIDENEAKLIVILLERHLNVKFPDVTNLYGKSDRVIKQSIKEYSDEFITKINSELKEHRVRKAKKSEENSKDAPNSHEFRM